MINLKYDTPLKESEESKLYAQLDKIYRKVAKRLGVEFKYEYSEDCVVGVIEYVDKSKSYVFGNYFDDFIFPEGFKEAKFYTAIAKETGTEYDIVNANELIIFKLPNK